MPKKPISVTLDEANLVWLQGMTERTGARSLSDTLDRLITAARQTGPGTGQGVRSVVGTIDIGASDPALDEADQAIRDLFARSLTRPLMVKEARPALTRSRTRRG